MLILKKKFKFEASHQLEQHGGKCARLHGHSWELEVNFICFRDFLVYDNNDQGVQKNMAVDYGFISEVVKPLIENRLDHWHLNNTLGSDSPTSEFVAKYIFDYLEKSIVGNDKFSRVVLHSVTIKETCTSECTYYGKEN